MHYRARGYSPRQMRFLQNDPPFARRAEHQYRYANNNPVSHIDPDGEQGTDPRRARGYLTDGGEPHPGYSPKDIFDYQQRMNNILLNELEGFEKRQQFRADHPILAGAIDRSGSALQTVGGAVEIGVGIVTFKAGGFILVAHGADTTWAGLQGLWTGTDHSTYTFKGVRAGAIELGASEGTANLLATGVDLAPALFTLRAAPGGTTRLAAAEEAVLLRELGGDLSRLRTPAWSSWDDFVKFSQKIPDPDTVFVVRGGQAAPNTLIKGTKPLDWPPHSGFSVQSAPYASLDDLIRSGSFPNNRVSITTVKRLMALARSEGVSLTVVYGTPGRGVFHATVAAPHPLSPELAEKISRLFRKISNPLVPK